MVVADLDVRARAEHPHAGAVVDAEVVADLEADDPHVAPRVDADHAAPGTPVPSRIGCSPG